MEQRSYRVLLFPFLMGIAVAMGILIGYFLSGNPANTTSDGRAKLGDAKVNDILNYILDEYVDTLDATELEDEAISSLLSRLDPHSSYIPASDFEQINEQMEGNFDGIGIEFNIQKDTIMVVAAISGGPSEALGIQSGDRIVEIEGKQVAGVNITNEDVMKKLRGKKGTRVKVGIFRPGSGKSRLYYTITRNKIPIYSLDAAIMMDSKTGYIKISRFSATTFEEYIKAFEKLKNEGMQQMILDLRDNPGGYLNAAVDLCDEFLPNGQKIVYTKGKARKRENYDATSFGDFENGKLVVLIDEGSASASEIVSGAIQDNDRGWIIGTRSFGKGLVQEEVQFEDGSALRLTVARYYTPSGRCIQRNYSNGNDAYYKEVVERMRGTTSDQKEKQASDSLAFKTKSGRTVYGGGGITPDIEVDSDTSGYSGYLAEIVSNGLINKFAFDLVDKSRKDLMSRYANERIFALKFDASPYLSDFFEFCKRNGIPPDQLAIQKSGNLIKQQLESLIGRALFGNDGYFAVRTKYDNAIAKAIDVMRNGSLAGIKQKK
jgi:carboxyl-terminal processing protease